MGLTVHHQGEIGRAEAPKSPLLILSILRRRKWSIVLLAAVLSALMLLVTTRMKPKFVATASVLIEQHNPGSIDISPTTGVIDAIGIRTQVDMMRSADLARGLVDELRLTELPEFSPPAHPRGLPPLIQRLLRLLGIKPASPPALTAAEREEMAAQTLLGMTSVLNDGRSSIIDIKAQVTAASAVDQPHAAALAARIANAYADYYVRFTGTMKSNDVRQANSLFDERVAVLKDKMQEAELAVETYRNENGLIAVDGNDGGAGGATVLGQQLGQLNAELTSASADRAARQAAYAQVSGRNRGSGPSPDVVASPLIQGLRQQQAELGAKEAALAMSGGADNEELMALRAAQRSVAGQIGAATGSVTGSLRSALMIAQTREDTLRASLAQLQKQVGAQGQTGVKLHELQNEADIARLLYTTYLKRFEETANQIGLQAPDATVVSRAGLPLGPSPPSKRTVAGAGIFGSILLAAFLTVVRERLRPGLRTTAQLEAAIGLETLGMIPKVRDLPKAMRLDERWSDFSEAVYSVRAVLKLQLHPSARIVMVTSALPREGKTVLSTSLARSAALAGERVLLVDCDLRRPAVARNVATRPGASPDFAMIRRDELSTLEVLTLTHATGSPQDLFASSATRDLFARLRERYDLVILDTPPVLSVSDARVLAGLADAAILVVLWQKTPEQLVSRAAATLRNSGATIAGAVISQVKFGELDAADGADAYFYRYEQLTADASAPRSLPQ